jgi:putative membrane protein
MKAYNPKHWFSLIFSFHKSDSFRMLIPAMLSITLLSSVLCYLEVEAHVLSLRSTTVMHSLLGFVISLLLVFRTNTAYDRWWEGRKLWGELVNNSRNLMLKIIAVVPPEHNHLHENFRVLITNYAFALKEHLRGGFKAELLEEHTVLPISQLKTMQHIPNKIAMQMNIEANKMLKENIITGEQLLYINEELRSFTNIADACERIRNTPIPYSYSSFIKRVIFIYVLTLPLGLIHDLKWATVPIVVFVFYTFAGLELLAEEIEDPFGHETNDLPTDSLANTIKKNLIELVEVK